jgi:ATP-dependent DNA helicase Q1
MDHRQEDPKPHASAPSNASSSTADAHVPSYIRRQELNARLNSLDIELRGVDEDIKKLKELRTRIVKEREGLVREMGHGDGAGVQKSFGANGNGYGGRNGNVSGSGGNSGKTNYMTERFEWAGELKRRMREVFGIEAFRLCQEG